MMKATARLYLTASLAALVAEGDPEAATLYCTPGDEIPDSAAERFGLVHGALPEPATKEGKGGSDKERRSGENKGGGQGNSPKPDDLTSLKYVGAAVAAKLAGAGFSSFAAIAAIDPAAPPANVLPATFRWADVIAAAKEKVPVVVAEPELEAVA